MTPRAMVIFGGLALCACGSTSATETFEPASTSRGDAPVRSEAPAPSGRVDGFFVVEGAPDPLACAADADCTYGQTLDASGCCGSFRDMAAAVQSTAYREWQAAHRAAHCSDHPCPSPPVPTAPPDCLFEVHCVEGRCDNACAW